MNYPGPGLGPLETCHKCVKQFKKQLSRFTALGSHLTDVYHRLYWQNSGHVRKYDKKSKTDSKCPPLQSNSLDDQLTHHIALKNDDELIDYFINGGEVENDYEWAIIFLKMKFVCVCHETFWLLVCFKWMCRLELI